MSTTQMPAHNGPDPASVPASPRPNKKRSFRERVNMSTFGWTFAIEFIFNLLLVVVVFSTGFSTALEASQTGFTGEFSFSWSLLGATIGTLFGGFGSFTALVTSVTIFGGTLWFVHWLSKKGKHAMVVLAFVVGAVAGGWLIWRGVDWENFGLGFVPVLVILVWTVLETIITAAIAAAVSRKSTLPKGNNH